MVFCKLRNLLLTSSNEEDNKYLLCNIFSSVLQITLENRHLATQMPSVIVGQQRGQLSGTGRRDLNVPLLPHRRNHVESPTGPTMITETSPVQLKTCLTPNLVRQ